MFVHDFAKQRVDMKESATATTVFGAKGIHLNIEEFISFSRGAIDLQVQTTCLFNDQPKVC
jgi:hypothetical protein